MRPTLGARIARRDADRFVGRRSELALLDDLFVDDPPASVALVHGPGGIGKSTLLREIARRGARCGWTQRLVDGRDLAPVPEALEQALHGVRDDERPLVLLDTYERLTALGGYLRQHLLPSLSEYAIVVVAGRRAPEPAWFEGGWEVVAVEIELGALSDADALELVRAHGVHDDEQARAVARWAGGSPLALTLAVGIAGEDPGWRPEPQTSRPEITEALIERVAAAELDPRHRSAIAVAALAQVTTPRLLRDAVPDVDPDEAYAWLASRTFSEPLRDGVALHEVVRRAMRADLRRREPELERELRRRIADHLHDRAVGGNPLLAIDLAALIETPILRWGFGWQGSVRYHIDSVRPGDAEVVKRFLCDRGLNAWWEGTRAFLTQAPEHVAVARDASGALCGYMTWVTPGSAPEVALRDPLLGPWLEHARELSPDGDAVLCRESIALTPDPGAEVQAMLGMSAILRSGLENPRYAYMPINPRHEAAASYAAALGAKRVLALDRHVGEVLVHCHVLDYGPGGVLGMARDVIYRELGLTPAGPAALAGDPREAVRAALRNLRVPHELARNELATGASVQERAEGVRALIHEAAGSAFGTSENEQLLQRVLERGYLDPAPSHELAAHELSLSRSAYFRRLRQAADRLADHIAGARP